MKRRVKPALALALSVVLALSLLVCSALADGEDGWQVGLGGAENAPTGEDTPSPSDPTQSDTTHESGIITPSQEPSQDPSQEPSQEPGEKDKDTGSFKDKLFVPLVIVVVLLAAAVVWLFIDRYRANSSGATQTPVEPPVTVRPHSSQGPSGYAVGNLHNIGKREEQQDSFCVSDIRDARATSEKGLLAVVADGMGGLQGGAAISQIVTDTFLRNYKALDVRDPDAFLYDCTLKAQSAVRDYMASSGVKGGSTLVTVLLRDGKLHYLSVGDSRIYLLRDGMLGKLNHAHNYGAVLKEQAARGEVDPEEPYVNPRKDALTSYIGIENLRMIDRGTKPLDLKAGDKVMLCSDGVFNALGDDALTRLLRSAPAPDAAQNMEQAVLSQNLLHQDNFTAILIDVGGTAK